MRFLTLLFLLLTATVARAELPSATDDAINKALASGKPAVIDLGARYCIPCKKMAPILESLATEYRGKATVLFIDVNENQAAPKRFRVQMIPTQIFFDARGKEVKRHMGFMDKADIVKELNALGVR
ncbi:Thioredoxin domain protein [Geobacter metallireducens RCH3]|uniref:Thioredoxin family protein n=1 Tax=Geobacter metallireducens (strain ATCC 53774 / DSM 7210 / GS-15) TaxID=269799 RepID=Q39YB4_GEOMG|nr:thioredoxin family protein [Geobacter metallireducens]ABB30760.1 thioredoxin family protein [Geobacter metallireducens GS-15]EHP88171.1 Thioredoxin domain protein [Geobacter metallireducens RCH3]